MRRSVKMDDSFENERGERRSFFCSNILWKEIKAKTQNCYPISQYIRLAIFEKMIRDEPEKMEYFRDLSR
jgi:hypothetical protein